MIKVILVDDERSVVEGMKKAIEWEKNGFKLVASAYDGREGYEKIMLYKPEVVIADITMPYMTGIELAEKLSKELPETKVILLTCHEDFYYARQAIRLNVFEYIVKHTMTQTELYNVLDRIKKEIDLENTEKEKDLTISQEISRNKNAVGKILINELLCKRDIKVNEIVERMGLYGYKLDKPIFTPAILRIDNYDGFMTANIFGDANLAQLVVLNITSKILRAEDIGEVFYKDENEYILIFNYKEDFKVSNFDRIRKVTSQIQKELKDTILHSCTIYIGGSTNNIGGLCTLYPSLKEIEESGFFLEDESIVCVTHSNTSADEKLEEVNEIGVEYSNALRNFDIEQAEASIVELMDIIREYKMAKTSAIMLAQKFIISIIDMVRSCSFENDRLSPEACISSLKYVHNVNSLKLLLLKYTYECIKTSKENAPFASNPEIARVVEYVNKNLDKEISLDSAARYICMNSSYFSRFFKNKTGENFVDFLSRVRIERAKQLILDTNLTIDEISQKVGYVNKSYFSRVFKKMTGMAPGQFRRLHKVNYSQEA